MINKISSYTIIIAAAQSKDSSLFSAMQHAWSLSRLEMLMSVCLLILSFVLVSGLGLDTSQAGNHACEAEWAMTLPHDLPWAHNSAACEKRDSREDFVSDNAALANDPGGICRE